MTIEPSVFPTMEDLDKIHVPKTGRRVVSDHDQMKVTCFLVSKDQDYALARLSWFWTQLARMYPNLEIHHELTEARPARGKCNPLYEASLLMKVKPAPPLTYRPSTGMPNVITLGVELQEIRNLLQRQQTVIDALRKAIEERKTEEVELS